MATFLEDFKVTKPLTTRVIKPGLVTDELALTLKNIRLSASLFIPKMYRDADKLPRCDNQRGLYGIDIGGLISCFLKMSPQFYVPIILDTVSRTLYNESMEMRRQIHKATMIL